MYFGANRRSGAAGQAGFTLIEILIVAALIALFAGLAVFNVQQMFNSNLRKAAIMETNRIGTALSFAHNDVAFFPKFNYLTQPRSLMREDDNTIVDWVDYIGFYNKAGGPFSHGDAPLSVEERWQAGGYFSMSQGRQGLAQGRVSIAKMHLPTGEIVQWPADPWGTPYVLYMVKVVRGSDPPFRFVGNLGEEPDYLLAVVSYGPNKVPGGVLENGNPSGVVLNNQRLGRLFTDSSDGNFQILAPFELDWDSGQNQKIRTELVRDPDQTLFPTLAANQQVIGVLDAGSDDLIFTF